MASTEAFGPTPRGPSALTPPLPHMLRAPPQGGRGGGVSRGLAHASHLCLHLCHHHPASPRSSPASSSPCASVSCQKKRVESSRRLSEEGSGGPGVGSTHPPPQAMGPPAGVRERTELALGRGPTAAAALASATSAPPSSPLLSMVRMREGQSPTLTPRVCVLWFLNDWLGDRKSVV